MNIINCTNGRLPANKKLSVFLMLFFTLSTLTYAQSGKESIFDGKTLKGWKKVAGIATYEVINGEIVGTAVKDRRNTFLVTEKEYGDFILELDIKIEGEKNNSGIQTRSHIDLKANNGNGRVYGRQVEIDLTDRKWTGGIYDEARRMWLYPLDLNPKAKEAFKTGEYNRFRIECIGNETKTWVNNIPVSYLIDTLDASGFIGLQVHATNLDSEVGNKVYFKNFNFQTKNLKPKPFPKDVYVVNLTKNNLSSQEKASGYKLLFDGKTTNGWVGAYKKTFPDKGWAIANGEISVLPTGGAESTNGGDIVTKEQFSAFDLSFEFKLNKGANSGVKYFVTLTENNKGSAIGLEYQVLDDAVHPDAKKGKDGNRTLASLYDLITAEKQKRHTKPIGQWNRGRVVVYPNNRVEHYLNGVLVLSYVRGSKEFKEIVANSKYKDWANFGEAKKGHILLQDHGDSVSFKNIKIKQL